MAAIHVGGLRSTDKFPSGIFQNLKSHIFISVWHRSMFYALKISMGEKNPNVIISLIDS